VRQLTLLAAVALLAACSRDIQNTEAIRQGVVDYLKARTAQTGLDVNLMNVEVTAVSFEKDQARATVYFRPKNGPEAGGMQMNYVLDRSGGKWVVRGRTENGVNPHGGSAMPPGGMPPGHPPVGSDK
jgi:hypothetical protein